MTSSSSAKSSLSDLESLPIVPATRRPSDELGKEIFLGESDFNVIQSEHGFFELKHSKKMGDLAVDTKKVYDQIIAKKYDVDVKHCKGVIHTYTVRIK